ncbi:PKD domain-containing protein [Sediminibacterium sp.]|uniref:PKD domain-containing protein n=1 Tax=Sediminibacterium sp. TaxID=1917865 RepID=UPI003F71A1A6
MIKNFTLKVFLLFVAAALTGSTLSAQNTVNFTVNNAEQCLPDHSFTFTNTSTGTFASYSWNFGDNTTSSAVTPPAKIYAQPGDYNVTLIGTDAAGNTSTVVKKVTVHPLPVMNFAVYNGGTAGSTYNFVSQGTINVGLIATNAWDFGDNTTATGANVNKVFASAGTYTVKLTGTSLAGCVSSVQRDIIVAAAPPNNTNNSVGFAVNNAEQCLPSHSFTLTNTSTGNFASYNWNFGDNTTSTLETPPAKSYAQAGDYNITLVGTDFSGKTYTIVKKVTVHPLPVMNFAVYNGGWVGATYNFVSQGTINAGLISTNAWDFGDNTSAMGANVNKVFTSAGTYTVKLTGTTLAGCVSSVERDIVVAATAPPSSPTPPSTNASFTVNDNAQCVTGNSFTFTNTTSVTGGETYLWDLGNGTTATTKDASVSYTTAGNYLVKLTVTKDGQNFITTQQVVVYPKPVVNFKILEKQVNGNSYTFIDESTVAFGNLTYLWDFGDGTTSTLSNPSKEYTAAGTTYTVTLTVSNSEGCSESLSKTITTCPKISTTDFTIQSTGVCEGANSFNFTNTSVATATGGSVISYRWVLGDGTEATTQNVLNKSYTADGDYEVKLFVTNTLGTCTVTETVSKKITVYPKPKAGYVLYLNTNLQTIVPSDIIEICNNGGTPGGGHDFQYISNSTIKRGQMLYDWNFGTTNITFREGDKTFVNPRIIFRENGLFPVELTVTSLEGCTDKFLHYINIIDLSNTDFSISQAPRQPSATPVITAQVTSIPPAGTYTYRWSSTGTPDAPVFNANHTTPYTFDRTVGGVTQNVRLRVSSPGGCTITRTKPFTSLVQPVIASLTPTFAGFNQTNGRPQFNVTASGTVNELSNTSFSSILNMGQGADVLTSSSTPTQTMISTNVTNFTYTASFPNDLATISYRVINNNGNLDAIRTEQVQVYATPIAKIAMRVLLRDMNLDPNGADQYIIRDNSEIAFGSLLNYDRTFTIEVKDVSNAVITTNTYTFPAGLAFSDIIFNVTNQVANSYSLHVNLQYNHPNPLRYDVNMARATAVHNTIVGGSGTGNYTPFAGGGSGSGSGTNPVIILNGGVVNSSSTTTNPFTVHPNPATSFTNVSYVPGNNSHVTINIYSTNGVLVKSQREAITFTGFRTSRVNVSNLVPGSYIIQVVNSNGTKRIGSARFLKY